MKIEGNIQPKSSFLSMEKDASLISNMLLRNERLKKLLYYTTPDCLDRKILTEDQSLELFGKNIKLVPKLYVDNSVLNYIILSFDNFTPNMTNPEFRDNIIDKAPNGLPRYRLFLPVKGHEFSNGSAAPTLIVHRHTPKTCSSMVLEVWTRPKLSSGDGPIYYSMTVVQRTTSLKCQRDWPWQLCRQPKVA